MWESMFGVPEPLRKTPIPARAVARQPSAPAAVPSVPTPQFPSVEEMARYIQAKWPLEAIWNFVRETRGKPAFQSTGTMAVDRLAGGTPEDMAKELAPWVGIPVHLIDNYRRRGIELWKDLFYPMFDLVGMAFQTIQPKDLPGTFYIFTDLVVVDLYYTEEVGRRPWK